MMLLSTLSYAEVSIRTLDNFHIDDLSENELTVAKEAEDINDGTQLGFHIERPHCIPNYPYLNDRGTRSNESRSHCLCQDDGG